MFVNNISVKDLNFTGESTGVKVEMYIESIGNFKASSMVGSSLIIS